MNYLLNLSKIAVAVSGGSDSVALLNLVSDWAKQNKIQLHILTVNHNLRKEAVLEGEYVKELCGSLGHKFKQFELFFSKNTSDFQNKARQQRYDLMTDHCRQNDILVLLTAHHLDDKLENFFIRLSKKSKIFGLSSIDLTYINNVQIFRPLHNIHKSDLQLYLRTKKIEWFEDETNLQECYLRNSIRKKLAESAISPDLVNICQATDKLASELNNYLALGLINTTYLDVKGYAIINLAKFHQLLPQIKFQLFSYVLTIIAGKCETPRKRSLEPMLEALRQNLPINKSLHGCWIKNIGQNLLIFRDFGRHQVAELDVKQFNHWDNRFQINFATTNVENIRISCLKNTDYKELKNTIIFDLKLPDGEKLPKLDRKAILFTFPVIKLLEKVVAIPNINYYHGDWEKKVSCYFNSSFRSRFIHFN